MIILKLKTTQFEWTSEYFVSWSSLFSHFTSLSSLAKHSTGPQPPASWIAAVKPGNKSRSSTKFRAAAAAHKSAIWTQCSASSSVETGTVPWHFCSAMKFSQHSNRIMPSVCLFCFFVFKIDTTCQKCVSINTWMIIPRDAVWIRNITVMTEGIWIWMAYTTHLYCDNTCSALDRTHEIEPSAMDTAIEEAFTEFRATRKHENSLSTFDSTISTSWYTLDLILRKNIFHIRGFLANLCITGSRYCWSWSWSVKLKLKQWFIAPNGWYQRWFITFSLKNAESIYQLYISCIQSCTCTSA